mmetsp:Transcript_16191/g.35186  ORF Transcript_16191/g.35186 Transcript_16191/m.35186 type:complete len:122 (-) Transcript_16191:643-1008(-)
MQLTAYSHPSPCSKALLQNHRCTLPICFISFRYQYVDMQESCCRVRKACDAVHRCAPPVPAFNLTAVMLQYLFVELLNRTSLCDNDQPDRVASISVKIDSASRYSHAYDGIILILKAFAIL